MCKSKIDFYHKEIRECANLKDFKKSWSLTNSLTGKNNKSTSITEISDNNNSIIDSKLIAEVFNEYFVSIGPNLASETNDSQPSQYTTSYHNSNSTVDATFHFHHINAEDIALALSNIKVNNSTGLDKIPAKVLKLSADIIAPSLSYIFNLSLATGIYIDDWKLARVIPVYISEDRGKCDQL